MEQRALSVCCLLLLAGSLHVGAEERISLDSTQLDGTWKVRNQNGSITSNGRVPGGIYSDLMDTGVLNGSIFYRNNDRDYRWVSLDNWTYTRNFDIPITLLGKSLVNLVFHGIDTVSDVYVNGQLIGSTNNMFRRYVFPITTIAKATNNTLEVRFQSPITYSAAQYAKNPIPPACVPDENQGECHANMIRKMQASFSWDWGPAFPSVGLWKSVEVEGFDEVVIRDVTVFPQLTLVNGVPTWRLLFTAYADLAQETFSGIPMGILHSDNRVIQPKSVRKPKVDSNGNYKYIATEEFEFEASEINSWWPNGMGDQFLYQLNVTLLSVLFNEQSASSIMVGFRTIKLIQGPVIEDVPGLSFNFLVNSVPFFAKGSNWIPAHILPELGSQPNAIRHLLQSAKEANMNMLRVWGGGVYESDLFYQIADELGILIWQDMMFACAMYPVDSDFLESARIEVQEQVRRLQYHPSVAIWAGNNENEAALRGNWYGTDSDFELYKSDYIRLYVSTFELAIAEIDESRPYVVSSPSNGYDTEDQGYIADNPYSPLFGDVHYYNYVSDGWDSFTYPDTRFASEYGFQSMPSYPSLVEVSIAADRKMSSEFTQRRQHHPGGYGEMRNQILYHLPLPDDDDSEAYFKTFIYYSQISQAMSTKTESEKYRRDRSKLTNDGIGQTMGALYWQLNDVWQAPTWASIELNGRWKMLHYFAKDFFAPILVSPEVAPDGTINIYTISDLLEDLPDLTLTTYTHSFNSFPPTASTAINVTLANSTSTLQTSTTVQTLFNAGNCAPNTCFLHFVLSNGTSTLSSNVYFPSSFRNVTLPRANITVEVPSVSETSATVNITTSAVAPFLWLETAVAGTFSDNGFILMMPQVSITFETWGEPLDYDAFVSTLTVKALATPETSVNRTYLLTNEIW